MSAELLRIKFEQAQLHFPAWENVDELASSWQRHVLSKGRRGRFPTNSSKQLETSVRFPYNPRRAHVTLLPPVPRSGSLHALKTSAWLLRSARTGEDPLLCCQGMQLQLFEQSMTSTQCAITNWRLQAGSLMTSSQKQHTPKYYHYNQQRFVPARFDSSRCLLATFRHISIHP